MNIFELFDNVGNKIRWPKLVIPCNESFTGKLHIFPAGPNSRYQGQLFVTDGRKYPTNLMFARFYKDEKGENRIYFYPVAQQPIRHAIYDIARNPLDKTKMLGQQFSFCCYCGTEITSKESLSVGYGPICARNWGLPWGGINDGDLLTRLDAVEYNDIHQGSN